METEREEDAWPPETILLSDDSHESSSMNNDYTSSQPCQRTSKFDLDEWSDPNERWAIPMEATGEQPILDLSDILPDNESPNNHNNKQVTFQEKAKVRYFCPPQEDRYESFPDRVRVNKKNIQNLWNRVVPDQEDVSSWKKKLKALITQERWLLCCTSNQTKNVVDDETSITSPDRFAEFLDRSSHFDLFEE